MAERKTIPRLKLPSFLTGKSLIPITVVNGDAARTERWPLDDVAEKINEPVAGLVGAATSAADVAVSARLASETARGQAQTAAATGWTRRATLVELQAVIDRPDGARGEVVGDGANDGAYYFVDATNTWVRDSTATLGALDSRTGAFEAVLDPVAPGKRFDVAGALSQWLGISASDGGVTIAGARFSRSRDAQSTGDTHGWLSSRLFAGGVSSMLGMAVSRRARASSAGDGRGWVPFSLSPDGTLSLFGLSVRRSGGGMSLVDPRGFEVLAIDRAGRLSLGGFTLEVGSGNWALRAVDRLGFAAVGLTKAGELKFSGSAIDPGEGGGGGTTPIVATPVMATELYLRDDRPLPLYVRNLLEARTDTPQVRATFTSHAPPIADAYTVEADDLVLIDPARSGATAELILRAHDQAVDTRHVVTMTVRKADTTAAGSPAARILMIGDSITNAGMADLVNRRLQPWGYAPTFIGTVEGASYSSTAGSNADGPLGEARTGRRLSHLTFRQDDADVDVLPVGGEAGYLNLAKNARLIYNPFLRASLPGDAPELIQNGHVFDLRFYLDRFGFADPDIVVLGLGTNDWRNITGEPLSARILADLAIVVPQIRAALPSARILIWLPTFPRAAIRDAVWKEGPRRVQQATIQYVRGLGDAGVHVVPVWASTTQEAGYLLDAAATVDPETGVLTADIDDSIHPYGVARSQIADVLAAAIAVHT